MDAAISAMWLQKGHFDFSRQDSRNTTSLLIRSNLCAVLSLPKDGLEIRRYPVGPQFSHVYWWREGSEDYAEAQFVAAISKDHPVLSLGVSIEKGREDAESMRAGDAMDRRSWDWPRLVIGIADILSDEVPAASKALDASVHVRIWTRKRPDNDRSGWYVRAFSFVDDEWFERHAGRVRVDVEAIVDYLRELDGTLDEWAIVHLARDFSPAEVDGMSPSDVASILMRFNGLRRRLRP